MAQAHKTQLVRRTGRIVRHHYPKELLPEDLRPGKDASRRVTVTVVEEDAEKAVEPALSLDEILATRRPPYRSASEIDDDLRRGREDADA